VKTLLGAAIGLPGGLPLRFLVFLHGFFLLLGYLFIYFLLLLSLFPFVAGAFFEGHALGCRTRHGACGAQGEQECENGEAFHREVPFGP
jgi:hypothetical protein